MRESRVAGKTDEIKLDLRSKRPVTNRMSYNSDLTNQLNTRFRMPCSSSCYRHKIER